MAIANRPDPASEWTVTVSLGLSEVRRQVSAIREKSRRIEGSAIRSDGGPPDREVYYSEDAMI